MYAVEMLFDYPSISFRIDFIKTISIIYFIYCCNTSNIVDSLLISVLSDMARKMRSRQLRISSSLYLENDGFTL